MGYVKKYLATTGISGFWDMDNPDILFLGPWCLSENKNKELIKGRPFSVIPSPWKPSIKIKEAADICDALYDRILPELSDRLNLIHGSSYPVRYWQIVIGPWLRHFIHIIYERYMRIERAFKIHPDAYTWVLPPEACRLTVSDTYDFVSIRGKATQDYYNLKLFSIIIRYLCPEKAVEKKYAHPLNEKRVIQRSKFAKKVFYGLKKMIGILGRPDIILSDMYYFNYLQILDFELKRSPDPVIFKSFRDSDNSTGYAGYSETMREKLRFEGERDKFTALLKQLIPGSMPMCYVENLDKYKKNVRPEGAKAVGSAVGWSFNEDFKFFAAEEMLKGAKLIEFQHGSLYGMLLACFIETTALEKDIFYTWGWKSADNKKTIPLTSHHLSTLWNTHKPAQDNVLFIGNSGHRYLCRFMNIFTTDDMPQYFIDKIRFFCALSAPAQRILLYRPYQEIGWHEIDIIRERMPDLKISSKNTLTKLMQNTKIAVIDHLGTTNLEALVINVPSIWFWDKDINLMRPEAQSYFNAMREAGILYGTPEEAAKKVNEIIDDPLSWWRSPKVQNARDIFCREFALAGNNWRGEWDRAFNEYK